MDLDQIMQYLIYASMFVGLGLNLYIVKKMGKGIMNIVFISYGMSLFLVGLSSAFVAIYEPQLHDISLHIFWHSIVYMAFLSLIWGGHRIKKNMTSPTPQGFNFTDTILFSAMLILTLGIFFIAPFANEGLYNLVTGSWWEVLGVHHLIAFLLGGFGAWYFFYIKGGSQAGKSIRFIGFYLLLLGIQHLWEIINETAHLLPITTATIELGEKFIVLPAIIFFILGHMAIIKSIQGK